MATGSADGAAALGSPTSPQAAGTTVCQTAHISPAPPAPPAPAAGLHTPFPARALMLRATARIYHAYIHTLSLSLLWLVKRARALAASRLRRSRFAAAKRAHSAGQPLAAGPSRGAAGLVKRASALASRHGTTRNMRLSLHLAEDLITAGDLGPSRLAHSLHSLRPSRHA